MAIGVALLLGALTVVSWVFAWRVKDGPARDAILNLRARAHSYWLVVIVLAASILAGERAAIILFAVVSALALREYLRLAPPDASDRRVVLVSLGLILLFQYWLIAEHWYGFYSIFIPVYAFLFMPVIEAMAGNPRRFLARTATVQWGLMVCVYCLSYVPALLTLEVPGYAGQNAKLLVWFVIVAQISDFLQYIGGRLVGRRPIAPTISPKKTWEGYAIGVVGATLVGTVLAGVTPYPPLVAAVMAWLAALMGFAGGLILSAIKRDSGVKDFGTLLPGHGGMLDRVDSLCFSAPLIFHITRYWFAITANAR